MKRKAIDVVHAQIAEILDNPWVGVLLGLKLNLLCNLFIIDHPEFNYVFPYRGIGMLDGYINYSSKILDEVKESLRQRLPGKSEEYDKLFESICNRHEVDRLELNDKKSLKTMLVYCQVMERRFRKESLEFAAGEKKQEHFISYLSGIFLETADFMQKYFELIGYWTKVMEDRAKRRGSGKGQIEAKEKRVKKVTEAIIKTFVNDLEKDFLTIDKATFHKMLCQTFIGSEEYPRHPQTMKSYRESIEQKLGKKIKLVKKVPF